MNHPPAYKNEIPPHGGRLVDRSLQGDEKADARKWVKSLVQVPLSQVTASDIEMIGCGAYSPLTGFMGWADYERVVMELRLANGLVWPLPITLPVDDGLASRIKEGQEIALVQGDHVLAIMEVAERFRYNNVWEAKQVYQTTDRKHPGVARLYQQGNTLLGGDIRIVDPQQPKPFFNLRYTPWETREIFAKKKWRRIAGFQTRNLIHRAHEHVIKIAMAITDGLFLLPLGGATKPDDFPAKVRMRSYQELLRYNDRYSVLLGVFPAAMRYAGPREAVFHALCRKNYGCTHFIVGRDHAGVGNYYHPSAAHQIFEEFGRNELGMELLLFSPTLYCPKCREIITPKTCSHEAERYGLSGTEIRNMLARGQMPPKNMIQPEVSWALLKFNLDRQRRLFLMRHSFHLLMNNLNNPQALKWIITAILIRSRGFLLKTLRSIRKSISLMPSYHSLLIS